MDAALGDVKVLLTPLDVLNDVPVVIFAAQAVFHLLDSLQPLGPPYGRGLKAVQVDAGVIEVALFPATPGDEAHHLHGFRQRIRNDTPDFEDIDRLVLAGQQMLRGGFRVVGGLATRGPIINHGAASAVWPPSARPTA